MLANPEGVDTIGTFSALQEATETPADATVTSAEETVNPETTVETAPEPGLKPAEVTEPDEGSPEPRSFKAKLDGKEIEFSVSDPEVDIEALKGELMMKHTFYKKTEELANERKAFEEKASQADSYLNELRSQLDYQIEQFDTPEMLELKQEDPSLYWEKYGEIKSKHDKYQSFLEKRQAELQKAQQEIVKKEISNWTNVIPEWLDEDVKKKETGEMYTMLSNEGFEPEMIGNIYDSRLIKIIRKAMLYDKASSKAIQSTKEAPKHVKSNSTATSKPKPEPTLESIFYGS